MKKKLNSLESLKDLIPEDEREQLEEQSKINDASKKKIFKDKDQQNYQNKWSSNKFQFREMVAKKNRKWLKEESEFSQFDYYKEYPDVYESIKSKFEEESKRNWLIHIITNFMPINRAQQVPKLPYGRSTCPFTGFKLTDVKNIATGDRDKHLAFTGVNTTVVLSGIALQELERFVIDCTHDFNSKTGQIVNYAIDKIRNPQK